MRTTGAPNSVTPGAEDAASAVPPVADSIALLVETCATLAIHAARTGDLEGAKHLLEQAVSVFGRSPADDEA